MEEGSFAAWMAKGNAFDAQGQSQRAIICYCEAERLRPRDAELLCRISKQYHDAMADTPVKEERRVLCRHALDYARRAAALDPKSTMAETLVAVCYGSLVRLVDPRTRIRYSKEVESHARRALQLDPGNDLACYVLGAWNLELANLSVFQRHLAKWIYGGLPAASNEEAERYLRKAIKINPSRPAYYSELGRVCAATGRDKEALTLLHKALAMPDRGKDDPDLEIRVAKALKKLGE